MLTHAYVPLRITPILSNPFVEEMLVSETPNLSFHFRDDTRSSPASQVLFVQVAVKESR